MSYASTAENQMATQSLTLTQQNAEKLAVAYRGFMRGIDTKNDFDLWYYGEKLVAAQEKLGFELVPNQQVYNVARMAYASLDAARQPSSNPGVVEV